MFGAIPPLPQYVFMAWCSVKKEQGRLCFYFTFTFTFFVMLTEKRLELNLDLEFASDAT